jgi:hypothetical protein
VPPTTIAPPPRMTVRPPVVTSPPQAVTPRPNDRDADNAGGPNDADGVK